MVAAPVIPARGRRHVATALACTVIAVLPVTLFSALAPLLREDLGLPLWWIGVGVAIAFAAAAVFSLPGGHFADRVGSRAALWTGVGVSSSSLLGMGLLARDELSMSLMLVLSGLGNAIIQPAANLGLARGVGAHRRGFAFGMKQAAVPGAAMLGGLALPLIGIPFGWRTAFVVAGCLAATTALLPVSTRRAGVRPERVRFATTSSLWMIAVGVGLATAAANAMAAYLVESAIVTGWRAGQAGMFLALGSVAGIASRLVVGWISDRMTRGWLALVAALMAAGALGFASLGFLGHPLLLGIGLVLGFGAGWGHNGLVIFSVVRLHPMAPARATSVVQAGAFAGPIFGPPLFGWLLTQWPQWVAWSGLAVLSLLAALMVNLARLRSRHEVEVAIDVSPNESDIP